MKSLKYLIYIISFFVINKTFAYSISSSLGTSICYGQTTTLNLLGSDGKIFNGGNSITWYKMAPNDSNECTPEPFLANGNSLNVIVTGRITIWCKPACGVSNTGALVSITLNVIPSPTAPAITQNGNVLTSSAVTNNQWYNQNGIINGATNQNYTPNGSGNYFAITTSTNGCSSSASNTISYTFLSVQDFNSANAMTIYPNPAKDHITIDCGNLANVSGWTIKISNTLGQEVFSGTMNTQQYVLPLKAWGSAGVYLVKIYDVSNNVVNTKKIILQ
ncbi:T9SS type A sorting domain-containing protein [Flavobacterium johnsoniae]|uniref:Por secretion system C-terminal sorting domain-containing protein n=1 Tax=Flavobacterium johnsoniae TaxID=986 RepID=A0A1M5HDG9_FLAJO|nr:T9SS type A sorting domain-containing protein [Flavobacterium johnsoniae]SHG14006.1 Por secretion system C-terminal sorting domain-containing protein [Flavobacterium johnsoniae]